MAQITSVNKILESTQLALLPEGPFGTIPLEIVESILFFTNNGESTRLVSWIWKDRTFPAAKNSNIHELQQTILLIAENLNPDKHAQWITDLAEIQDTHQSHSNDAATFAKVKQLFLINKGLVIGILRKLSVEDRNQLQRKIGHQLPDSMKDIFKISTLDIKAAKDIQNLNLDTFFTLLQSCQPLSVEDREAAFFAASYNVGFVKLLLTDGPLSEKVRKYLGFPNDPAFIKSVLANNSNSEEFLGEAACRVTDAFSSCYDVEKRVKLLLGIGSISEKMRRKAAIQAFYNNRGLEVVRLLLANGPTSKEHQEKALWMVADINPYRNSQEFFDKEELLRFLLETWQISEELREKILFVHPDQETVNLFDPLYGCKIAAELGVIARALRPYMWYCTHYFLTVILQIKDLDYDLNYGAGTPYDSDYA